MGKSLILAVKIIGDANSALAAMDQVAGKSDKFGSALNTASKYSAVALAGITAGAIAAGAAASDLEQSTGAVASVFGEYADKMTGYAENAADAVGLSQNQYNESATLLGAQLKNMGISMEEVGGTTNDLIGLGADLAATFGGTTADATAALSSLLRGERDPIEKYGVSIKQADIEAQKAAMGLDHLTGEAAKNADLQATLALLTSQTADAQGQFSRETDSAAGAAQIAAAHFENAKAALGEALLPIMAEASDKLAELAKWFQENAEWITPLVGVIAGLAAGILVINGAYKAFAAVQAIQTAAQWAQNAAWLASPITWIVLAIIAAIALLVVAIIWVVDNWDLIKEKAIEVWNAVIDWIKQAIEWLVGKFNEAIAFVAGIWQTIVDAAAAAWNAVIGWIQSVIDWVKLRVVAAIAVAAYAWNKIKETASAVWNAVIGWIQRVVNFIRDGIANAIQGAVNWFVNLRDGATRMLQGIIDWVRNLLGWLRDLASNAIPGWAKDLLGMSSFSMPITPEVAALTAPDYSARMRVTPDVDSITTPAYSMAAPASIAESNIGAMVALTRMILPSITAQQQQQAAPTVYEDNSEHHYHFPNYLGDKDEIVDELDKALERRRRNREGLMRA